MKFKRTWRSMLPYKTQLKSKSIKRNNETFHSLDRDSQKKEIALDVLSMIASDTMVGSHDSYWDTILYKNAKKITSASKLQKELRNVESCSVCARGAMMLSTIRVGNKLKYTYGEEGLIDGNNHTQKHFDYGEYSDMENVYEDYANTRQEYDIPYDRQSTECLANIFLQVMHTGTFVIGEANEDYLKSIVTW